MKKHILILAFLSLGALSAFSQGIKSPSNVHGVNSGKFEEYKKSNIFGVVNISSQDGRDIVMVEFDEEIFKQISDKQLVNNCRSLSSYKYRSLIEALNVLSAYGWSVVLDYTSESKHGTAAKMIISKEVDKLPKFSPWEGKNSQS